MSPTWTHRLGQCWCGAQHMDPLNPDARVHTTLGPVDPAPAVPVVPGLGLPDDTDGADVAGWAFVEAEKHQPEPGGCTCGFCAWSVDHVVVMVAQEQRQVRELPLRVEVDRLRTQLAEYENGITWGTSCLSCARVLDSAYRDTVRAEAAESVVAAIRDLCDQADPTETEYRDGGLLATDAVRAVLAGSPTPTEEKPQ